MKPKLLSVPNGLKEEIRKSLKEYFPHGHKLKHIQKSAIRAALLGHDTFIQMPTGYGKSLCFQLPAVINKGITVVFSPLHSLIQDQITKLKQYQIPCELYDARKMAGAMSRNEVPDLKLLYVTPEKAINNSKFLPYLQYLHQRNLLSRFVFDEAQCVPQWGNSFRPDYLQLSKFISRFRKPRSQRVPIMALTACNDKNYCDEIIEHLGMGKCKKFKSKMERRTLFYHIFPKTNGLIKQMVEQLLQKYPNGSGIIYCLTVDECKRLASLLGDVARPYYSGMSKWQRKLFQNSWMSGKIRVLCATSAFGMGIDKSNVRFIVHHSLPRSLTEYIQETGRAGRDGQLAECVILYKFNDQFRIMREIQESGFLQKFQRRRLMELREVVDYCETYSYCGDTDLDTISKKKLTISPYYFKRDRQLHFYEVEEEDWSTCLFVLEKIEEFGSIRLNLLEQICAEQDLKEYQRMIRRLILSGHLRVSILTNNFKKCTPSLSISEKGHLYLHLLRSLVAARIEIQQLAEFAEQVQVSNVEEHRKIDTCELDPRPPSFDENIRKWQESKCLMRK